MKKRLLGEDDVRRIISGVIHEIEFFGLPEKEAEQTCNYIAGVVDVEHTLLRWIEDGGEEIDV